NAGRLLASGYSCRSQARRLSEAALRHPLQALLEALKRGGQSPRYGLDDYRSDNRPKRQST
ncbi:hypothetical protein ACFFH6_18035, partial [Halomonas organivorans]